VIEAPLFQPQTLRAVVRRAAGGCPISTPYKLYGAEVSLFSGKARAYLRFKNIPFEEIFATRKIIDEVLQPATGLKMVPVVQTPEGEFLQDTSVIIDTLEERFPEPSVLPTGPVQRLVALLLEAYGDEWLLMPAMHYRWAYKRKNLLGILRAFGEIVAPGAPRLLHPIAGLPIALYFGGAYGTVLGINRHTRPEIERTYEAFLARFDAHLEHTPYLLGSRPSIADYGFIGPLYAHLYRDPAPGELMRRLAPRVADWVERVEHPTGDSGEFLGDDQVPETLHPILRTLFSEYAPIALDTMQRTAQYCAEHPDRTRFPRFIGSHEFRIGQARAARYVTPYTQWMWQRPLRWYQGLQDTNRERADALLSQVGGLEAMAVSPEVWVGREGGRVVPVDGPSSAPKP